jgi:hypothetical protein
MPQNINININTFKQILDEILNEKFTIFEAKLDKKLDKKLDEKFSIFEAKMDVRFNKIELRLDNLENYNKNTSDAFEEQSTDILNTYITENIYRNILHFGTSKIKYIFLKKIYNANGQVLTDLDGCLLVDRNKMSKEKLLELIFRTGNIKPSTTPPETITDFINRVKKELNSSKKNNSQTINIPANETQNDRIQRTNKFKDPDLTKSYLTDLEKWKDENVLYVIESKNHIIKTDVDKKINQMIQFQNILLNLAKTKSKKENYNNMVKDYNLHTFPQNIHLYIATNCISKATRDYISNIYTGKMSKKTYEETTYAMLLEFNGWHSFKNDVQKQLKLTNSITNYDDVLDFLNAVDFRLGNTVVLPTNIKGTLTHLTTESTTESPMLSTKIQDLVIPDSYLKINYEQLLIGLQYFRKFMTNYKNLCSNFKWGKEHIGLIYLSKVQDFQDINPTNVSQCAFSSVGTAI